MANQLAMDKVQAVKHLEQAGYSERRIARQLGISRKAVRRHLGRGVAVAAGNEAKETKALTGSALTGCEGSKETKALTGSEVRLEEPESHQSPIMMLQTRFR